MELLLSHKKGNFALPLHYYSLVRMIAESQRQLIGWQAVKIIKRRATHAAGECVCLRIFLPDEL
jgi:hypothetical protein